MKIFHYEILEGKGTISHKHAIEKVENGFGFDEIFELPNGKTLAELPLPEKNKIRLEH